MRFRDGASPAVQCRRLEGAPRPDRLRSHSLLKSSLPLAGAAVEAPALSLAQNTDPNLLRIKASSDARRDTRSASNHQITNCKSTSQVEELAQAAGLRTTHGNLRLFLIVHAELIGALEPGYDFANVIDVDQKRAVRPPE